MAYSSAGTSVLARSPRASEPARHCVRAQDPSLQQRAAAHPSCRGAESVEPPRGAHRDREREGEGEREPQKMDGVGSFGAGRAGSTVDLIAFAKQPQTILRVLSWIFSLVVFASIVNEGYVNFGSERLYCIFNKNADACNYGVFVGLVGLLACSFFGLLDYKFSSISSIKDRKKAVMLEIGFSGFWTFLYFVSFCFLANQWSRTTADELPLSQGSDAARAAIAFSFFSIITWAGLTVRAVQKYLLGTDMSLFTTEHLDGGAPTQPYPSNSPVGGTTETTETYQSPPFTENNAAPTYQVPIY